MRACSSVKETCNIILGVLNELTALINLIGAFSEDWTASYSGANHEKSKQLGVVV